VCVVLRFFCLAFISIRSGRDVCVPLVLERLKKELVNSRSLVAEVLVFSFDA
jgi:hypothetical protein